MPTPKFKPGQSGNPNGRTKDKTPATLLRKSIADAMPEIILSMIEKAKSGDMATAKALLDRCCPALKSQAMPISLPIGLTLAEQGNNIIMDTKNGTIPPDVGSQLISALANQAKIVEVDELARRIQELENKYEC